MARKKKSGTPITDRDIRALNAYRDKINQQEAVNLAERDVLKWMGRAASEKADAIRDATEYQLLAELLNLAKTRSGALNVLQKHAGRFLDELIAELRTLPEWKMPVPSRPLPSPGYLRLVVDNTR